LRKYANSKKPPLAPAAASDLFGYCAEWYFKNKMDDGRVEVFDGMTPVKWTAEDMICFLQEFGCNEHRCNPYQDGPVPKLRDEQAMGF
jgi:hypothetical protein